MTLIRRHPVLVAATAVMLLFLGVVVATAVAVWRAAHADDASRVDRADVIVVLGAAQYSGRPSPVFAGRLDHAALLYQDGRAGLVLVVGGGQPGDQTTEAESGRQYLIDRGLPESAVLADPRGNTTLESLEAASAFMQSRGLESAFLVSDPWHNLRIKRMAGDLGIRGYASATWHSAATSETTRFAGYTRETLAYLFYRIFGR